MNKVTKNILNLVDMKKEITQFIRFKLKRTSKYIELRAISNGGKVVGRTWSRDEGEILEFCSKHNGKNNIYFGTSTRVKGYGKKEHCREVIYLWTDIDFKDFEGGEKEARVVLSAFKYQPSFIISTGGGLHCYWVLDTVLDAQKDMDLMEQALKEFAGELNADPSRAEIASLLRVPGTMNMKPERDGFICKIEFIDLDQKVTIQEIIALKKPASLNKSQTTPKTLSEFRKAIVIGNRDTGSFAYVNAFIKKNGVTANDSALTEEVFELLDKAGGDNLEAIKKKVPDWIKTAHELFDSSKKLSSLELAERVIYNFKGLIIFQNGRFFAYSNGFWKRVRDEQIKKLITEQDGSYTSRARIADSLEVLKCRIASEHIEPHPGIICLINGTLELSSKKLLPHSPDYHLLNNLNIKWCLEDECKLWIQTLNEIFDGDPDREEKILFLQEWFGYCLVPETWQHKFLLMVGSGGNGKSLILDILSALVGHENISNAMLTRLSKACVRAELSNKLINISSEMKAEGTLSSDFIKAIVAGDRIEARFKYGNSFSYKPYARLVSATNELPRLLDFSNGFRRRIIILLFNRSFQDHEQDKHRKEKLITELPAILLWAVAGLGRLRENDAFTIPVSSDFALSEYMAESDPVRMFADDELVEDESGHLTSKSLYKIYAQWAIDRGFQKLNIIIFGKRLKALGFTKRPTNGKEVWCVKTKTNNLPT